MSDSAYGRIVGTPATRELYEQLLVELDALGPYEVRHHKASVQMVGAATFLGVAPAADGLLLTLVTPAGDPNTELLVRSAADLAGIRRQLALAYRPDS